MKTISLIFLIFLASVNFGMKAFSAPFGLLDIPRLDKKESSRNLGELIHDINSLSEVLGSYPPAYKSEDERQRVYKYWSSLLKDVSALSISNLDDEIILFLHVKLYRQGHNMDVRFSAKESGKYAKKCIMLFPSSKYCHQEAVYLYLQATPLRLQLVEKSLKILTELYKPNLNEEVEKSYVFYHLYSKENLKAASQIAKYLKEFPEGSQASIFRKILKAINNN